MSNPQTSDPVEDLRQEAAAHIAEALDVPVDFVLDDPSMSYHNVMLLMMDPPADTVFEDVTNGMQGVLNEPPPDSLP